MILRPVGHQVYCAGSCDFDSTLRESHGTPCLALVMDSASLRPADNHSGVIARGRINPECDQRDILLGHRFHPWGVSFSALQVSDLGL